MSENGYEVRMSNLTKLSKKIHALQKEISRLQESEDNRTGQISESLCREVELLKADRDGLVKENGQLKSELQRVKYDARRSIELLGINELRLENGRMAIRNERLIKALGKIADRDLWTYHDGKHRCDFRNNCQGMQDIALAALEEK